VHTPDGNHYVVKGLLGQGGFGAVYLVSDKRSPLHLFALKEITNPDHKEHTRFLFEGEILKRLRHPALPRVYQVFDNPKLRRVYILMDFIRGQNLEIIRQRQPDARFPLSTALSLIKATTEALSYIHQQHPPIVHRDIKPSNIIVPLGMERTVLVDFGIAKEYVHNTTTTSMRHGSPGYASPEHYSSGTNIRTDVYGLGATIYTLLTGIVPPDAITRATAYRRHDPLQPLIKVDPAIPLYVSQAIERSMAISNEDRFPTIDTFWQHLTHPVPTQPYHMLAIQDLKTSLANTITGEDVEKMATLHLRAVHPPRLRTNRMYRSIFLVLLVLLCMSIPIDFVLAQTYLARKAQTVTTTVYPNLASHYAGTIGDPYHQDVGKPLYLKEIHQQQQHFQGRFEGLGIVNMFNGQVTSGGHVTFTVQYPGGTEIISCEGDINLGGGLVGTYFILNNDHQSTGLHGVWNGQP
jgi:serine/threonine protein kinase